MFFLAKMNLFTYIDSSVPEPYNIPSTDSKTSILYYLQAIVASVAVATISSIYNDEGSEAFILLR